ncbi:hypothetical protein [Erythrobacter sp.]|uniref:hypothetical protein n=1 Tax=Erythrobacter sp. TaxID=1042 RepID=UPI002EA196B0|nr:hypothetical protein [Erythrobacter sp.]
MLPSLSPFSLAALFLYAFVVAACAFAAREAQGNGQPAGHGRAWLMLALFFAALMLLRAFDVEETIRSYLRDQMRAEGSFEARSALQTPLVVVLIMGLTIGGLAAIRNFRRHAGSRRNLALAAGWAGALFMLCVIALRMVSLHAVDRLLYGPLKLNWVGDIGASLIVFGAAIYYAMLLRGHFARSRR